MSPRSGPKPNCQMNRACMDPLGIADTFVDLCSAPTIVQVHALGFAFLDFDSVVRCEPWPLSGVDRLLRSVLAVRRHPGRLHVLHHLRRSGDSRKDSRRDRDVLHRKDSGDGRRDDSGLAAGVRKQPPSLKLGQPQADAVTNLLNSFSLSLSLTCSHVHTLCLCLFSLPPSLSLSLSLSLYLSLPFRCKKFISLSQVKTLTFVLFSFLAIATDKNRKSASLHFREKNPNPISWQSNRTPAQKDHIIFFAEN